MNKLTILVAALIGLWMLSGCGSTEPEKKSRIRPVKTQTIGDFSDPTGKGYPGVTKENQKSEVSFRVGGPIIKYNVVEGAKVKKGDLIAEIDPRDFKIDVQSTKARNDQTKAESDRYYRLWKKGSVAKNDYDLKYANYLEAKADWENAKNALNDTRLYALYTGFYGPKLAQLGDKVRVREAITTIVDLSSIEVNTTIPEQLAIQLNNFDSYDVTLEAYPDIVFSATLKELEKKPTPEGYPLHLYLGHANDENDDTQIKVAAGMSCRVNIILKNNAENSSRIIIPITSIFEGDTENSTMVWLINTNNNTVQQKSVVTGDLVGHDGVEITKGINVGEEIVIAGVHRLQEGDTINNIDILNSN